MHAKHVTRNSVRRDENFQGVNLTPLICDRTAHYVRFVGSEAMTRCEAFMQLVTQTLLRMLALLSARLWRLTHLCATADICPDTY